MRFSRPSQWGPRLARVAEVHRSGKPVEALRLVVDGLRPGRGAADPEARARALLQFLEAPDGAEARATLGALVRDVVGRAGLFHALTESGIPDGRGFLEELVHRLGRRVLPRVPDPSDLRDLIHAVFHGSRDHEWVAAVSDGTWRRLLALMGITPGSFPGAGSELAVAIHVLGQHASSLGLGPEITTRLPHRDGEDSPFLALGGRVARYLEAPDDDGGARRVLLDQALETVARCRAEVQRLRAEKHLHGTSLHLTGLTFRILALLDRVELLLNLTAPVERDLQGSVLRLFRDLVRAEKTREHVRPHLKASADLLAYQVVEHAARKGSKYITSGRPDYVRFLYSSMGGGLLVALFALAKVGMGHWEVPLAVQALVYGLNYSLCFVLIYLTGATLATKQPAMTANTLARSLGEEGHDLSGLEDLVVRVWRSQFVSFLGNLVVALPVAMLLSRGFAWVGATSVVGPEEAGYMLEKLHPWRSGTVVYAAVAGVLLFAAGLISGWVDNLLLHHGVPHRVAHHPVLVRLLDADGARRVANGLDRSLGAVVGNVFLGFGLGSMGTLGEILGLPLDIRHIAFASAQFGTALDVLGYRVSTAVIVQTGLGVAAIGLVNFLVSFGLSLALALESRGVTFGETRLLLVHLLARARRRPLDWFFPPKRTEEPAGVP